jgi:hypothetical protein
MNLLTIGPAMKLPLTLILLTATLHAGAQDVGALTAETKKTVLPVVPKVVNAMQEAVAEKGVAGAIPVCKDQAPRLIKEVRDSTGWSIRRVSLKPAIPNGVRRTSGRSALSSISTCVRQPAKSRKSGKERNRQRERQAGFPLHEGAAGCRCLPQVPWSGRESGCRPEGEAGRKLPARPGHRLCQGSDSRRADRHPATVVSLLERAGSNSAARVPSHGGQFPATRHRPHAAQKSHPSFRIIAPRLPPATKIGATREIAVRLAGVAQSLEGNCAPKRVAAYLSRCLFSMFAEDVSLPTSPILRDFKNIECRDAVLAADAPSTSPPTKRTSRSAAGTAARPNPPSPANLYPTNL